MPTLPDLLYVTLFALALPLWDFFISWPRIDRQLDDAPDKARQRLWVEAIVYPWALVAIGVALWTVNDRPWSALGFDIPQGWRLWVAVGVVLLIGAYQVQAALAVARDPDTRASVRKQFSGKLAEVLPRTRSEVTWFGGVSLTAGFCEEFLYRGYFIWVLASWLSWWGAAALSVLLFAIGHAYQGWQGVVRTGVVGLIFSATVALFSSLWPAILLHTIVDLGGGVIAWLALRDDTLAEGS